MPFSQFQILTQYISIRAIIFQCNFHKLRSCQDFLWHYQGLAIGCGLYGIAFLHTLQIKVSHTNAIVAKPCYLLNIAYQFGITMAEQNTGRGYRYFRGHHFQMIALPIPAASLVCLHYRNLRLDALIIRIPCIYSQFCFIAPVKRILRSQVSLFVHNIGFYHAVYLYRHNAVGKSCPIVIGCQTGIRTRSMHRYKSGSKLHLRPISTLRFIISARNQ